MLTPLPRFPTGSGVAGRLSARLGAVAFGGFLLWWAQPILIPLVLAVLGAMMTWPVVRSLVRRRIPPGLAILTAVTMVTLPLLTLIGVFVATFAPLREALPMYKARIGLGVEQLTNWAVHLVDNPERQAAIKTELSNNLIPRMMEGGVDFMQSATTLLGYAFLTLFFAAFMLIEGRRFREKFTEAYGPRHPLLQSLEAIGRDVRAYVVAKSLISGLTALCVWLLLAACDVDFAAFWGLIAFPLNFIPTVGALIASLPPVVLVLIDPNTSALGALGVTAGLFAVNGVIGSYVDPRFVGRQVKLSPLVVFLSMVFWGLLWGPMGMILAVPIMVSVKVVCSHVPGLEPIAILMKA